LLTSACSLGGVNLLSECKVTAISSLNNKKSRGELLIPGFKRAPEQFPLKNATWQAMSGGVVK
jgi:hypothetical protein